MIDISQYRSRIGTFYQKMRSLNSRKYVSECQFNQQAGNKVIFTLKIILLILIQVQVSLSPCIKKQQPVISFKNLPCTTGGVPVQPHHGDSHQLDDVAQPEMKYRKVCRIYTPNFLARYTYGNKQSQRGIKNIHLNIRSLSNKVVEVKNIILEQSPHIFGISECELRNHAGFDVDKLKVPGYTILFPKSWSQHGLARVVVYVKKSFKFKQVHDIGDDLVQSVWLKGGFNNSRDIYFCHFYREHTSTLGSSISTQREQLGKFLTQWEEATVHDNSHGINEVHISGDMNLDSLSGRWLQSDYHLVTLSRLVQTSCNLGNFSQLVQVPTRYQYNNTKQETDYSCIDHVYTNSRLRCSGIMVTPFGSSDHDLVGYIRLTKIPPEPSRTIRKRTYKNFVLEEFLEDLKSVDWSEVLIETDVDMGVEVFTEKFLNVLDLHAPWIKFQRRKHYSP